jgi:hypothetical protein
VGLFKKECDHTFGPVDDKNFQYCTKCGRAIQVFVECFHVWKKTNEWTESRGSAKVFDVIYEMQCSKCGEIKIVSMNKEIGPQDKRR